MSTQTATPQPTGMTAAGPHAAQATGDVPARLSHLLPEGRVIGLWGTATVRTPEGLLRALKVGDIVHKGDVVVTTQDGIVQIEPEGEPVDPQARVAATPTEIDRVISDLDQPQPDNEVAPTAALDGGSGGGLAPGVRVDRIIEVVDRNEYNYATQERSAAPVVVQDLSGDEAVDTLLTVMSSSVTALESGSRANLGLSAPTDPQVPSSALVVTVTGVPEVGHVERADGTLVTVGMQIPPGELAGLVYVPPADYTAGTPVGAFNYVVSNGSVEVAGGTSIQVTPVNDAPMASAGILDVAEDVTVLSGSVSATDPDSAGTALTYSLGAAVPAGLAFSSNGTYTFDASNPAYQSLGVGQSAVITVPYTVTDDEGASSTANLTITVTGTNDGPVAVVDTGTIAEDFTLGVSASGGVLANDTDVDAGDTRSVTAVSFGAGTGTVGAALAGTYGTLTLNADGSYSYTADSGAAQALGVGQSANDVFSYTVRDASGATSTTTLTITVTGTNDAPVAQAVSASAAADGAVVSGSVSATDIDANATLSFALSNAAPPGLTFNSDGSYSFDASNPAYRSLGAGQSAVLTIPYQVTDDQGITSAVANLFITVTGTNDGPVAVADTGAVGEDFALSVNAAGGVLANDTDVDTGDARAVSAVSFGSATGTVGTALAGTYGTLTLNADGSYSYAADSSAAQALGVGQTASDVFSYTVRDAAGAASSATLTIVVTGTEDAPVAQAASFGVAEDAALLSGSVVATDVDANAALTFALNGSAPAGLTFNADGSYSFDAANSAYQSLGAGQSAVLTVPYTVTDDQGATSTANLVITVTGTNDAPVAQAASFSVAEDAALLSGSVAATDVDANATLTFALNGSAPAGLTFNTDGSYSFDAANSVYQSLGVGQSAVLTVPYTVIDDQGATSTANLVISVTGTNDVPVAQAASFTVAEDAALLSGSVVATDVDANSALTFALNGSAPAGLTFNADGSYSFDASNTAYQSLGVGQSAVLTVPYTVTDDQGATSTANLVITVTGTNDVPVAQAASFTVAEDAALLSGSVVATDVDANAALTFALNGSAPAGLTFNTDGSYSFDAANSAYQSLGVGQSAVLTVPYTITDDQGATSTANLVITVTGTNDVPVAQAASFSVAEDAALLSGSVVAADVDANAALTFALNGSAPAGLTFNADGSYSFDAANSAYQSLGVGQSAVLTVPYTVTDDQGTTSTANLVITVTGTNDAPVAAANTGTVAEDATLSTNAAGGVLANDTDVDTGDTKTVSAVSFGSTAGAVGSAVAGTYGSLALNADGSYSYLANSSAAQALGVGQSATDTFTYTVRDAAGATSSTTLTLTVTGTNDAPVAVANTGTVAEDATLSVNAAGGVLANATDVDTGDAKTVSTISFGSTTGTVGSAVAGTYGSLTLNADGSYSYVANSSTAQALGVGQSATDTFTYTVRDTAGATSPTTLTLTITGTNDAPVAIANTGTVAEDATLSVNAAGGVLANDTDVDAGDTKTVSAVSFGSTAGTVGSALTGTYGTLTLNANGSYAYVANSSAAQALGVGQSATDTFTYAVRDTAGATSSTTLTLTVTGTNDAPVAVADTAAAVEAGGTANTTAGTDPSGNVLSNDTDVDTGDTRTVSAITGAAAGTVGGSTAGAYGTLVLNADGSYTYTVNNSLAAVQALRTSASTLTDTFTYTLRDGGNATSSTTLTLTIQGANDAPVGAADTAAMAENAIVTASAGTGVLANDTDVDSGDTRTVSAVSFGAVTGTVGTGLAGTYGTLTLNADGSYSYSANLAAADALAAGQTATDAFTYTVRDTAGATSATTLSFTLTGTNDAPVNTVPGAQITSEDTSKAITGLSIADVDAGSVTVTLSVTNGTLSISGGTATISNSGTGTVTLTGTVAQVNATLATNVTYVPTADFNGAATLTLSTNDGITTTVSTVPITVGAVADIAADTASTNEDTAAAISVLANDSFANAGRTITAIDGNAITAGGAAVAVANGSVTLNSSGVLTFTPTANYNGTTSFNYTVTSGGVTETASATVTVVAVNDAPVNTVPGAITVTEDVATALTGISVGDVDAGSDTITVTLSVPAGTLAAATGSGVTVSGSGTGSLVLSGTQTSINSFIAASSVTYTTVANANGTVTLTVTTNDGGNTGSGGAQTDVDTLTLNIAAVNDAPVNTMPGTQAATEDTSKAITGLGIADVDADSGIMTVTLAVTNGTLTVSGGSATIINSGTGTVTLIGTTAQINATLAANVTYVPTANFNGAATLTMITSDNGNTGSGGLLFDTDTVTINVSAVNDAPVNTMPSAIAVPEDVATALTGISVGDVDAGSGTITVTLSVPAGTLAATTGSGVTVSGSGTGSLVLSGTQASINSFIAASSVTYTTAANANGTVTLTVTTNDGGNTGSGSAQTDIDTVTLNITAVNDAPVNTLPGTQAATEDTSKAITGLSISDVDNSTGMTVILSVGAGTGTLTVTGGSAAISGSGTGTVTLTGTTAQINATLAANVTYVPTADFNGSATLTISTSDGTGASPTVSSVPITVAAVADITADTAATNEDTAVAISVLTNDTFENGARVITAVDGQAITAGGAAVAVANGSVTLNSSGVLTFTPAANYNTSSGTTSFTYTVTSGGVTETATATVTVTAVNDNPVNTIPTAQTVLEDTLTSISGISVNDPDVTYGPATHQLATTQLSVSNGILQVTLTGGATVSAGANGSSTLTLSGTQAAINATLATLAYRGNTNYNGGDSLVITSRDGVGQTDSDSVSISVTAVNDAPSGTNITVTLNEDAFTTLSRSTFGFSDLASEGNSFVSVTVNPTSAGTLTLNGVAITGPTVVTVAQLDSGLLRFTPVANANGTGYANFTFQVTDSGGTANGGVDTDPTPNTVTFNVTALNDGPVAVADAATAVEAGGVANATAGTNPTGNVLTNDTDADSGDTKTVSAITGTAAGTVGGSTTGSYGTLVLSSTGAYTYTVNNSLTAVQALRAATDTLTDTFTYTMRDAAGVTSTASLTVTIQGADDAPVNTVPAARSYAEDVTNRSITGLSVADVDSGDVMTVTLQVAHGALVVTGGSAVIAGSGTDTVTLTGSVTAINATLGSNVRYAPDRDFNGTDTITMTTQDTASATAVSTVTITITASNDIVTDTATTAEDTPVTIAVLANDTFENADRAVTAINGNAITAGGPAVAVTNGSVTLDNSNQVIFAPAANYNGTASFTYTVTSGGVTETSTVTVTVAAINDAPTTTASTVAGTEDTALVFTWANFNVSDVDLTNVSMGVRITTLPADGVLQTSTNGTTWTNVTANQLISQATINSGFLRFVPDANESGDSSYGGSSVGNQQADYARFTFTPYDGAANGTAATMTIDIAPSADGASFSYNAAATTIGTLAAPTSVGLTSDYFQTISTLTSGGMSSTPDAMETGIETAVATSSSLITNVGAAGTGGTGTAMAIDDAYRMQGLVYLEAGKSYVFSGYADDTVRLEIGGNTLLSGNWGGGGQANAGTFTATSFTPTATGYYSLEFMVYNTSGPGNYELNVSINGAAAVDASTANLRLYQSINQLDAAGALHGAFIANGSEGGYYPAGTSATAGTIHLAPLTVALADTDGSETLTSVRMQDIAVGAVLTDGTHSFTAATGSTTADITTWNLAQLAITPASGTGEMNLRVVALTTETATGEVATSSLGITINGTSLSEINTYNADALLGQVGADTFTVSESGSGLAVAVSQGPSGTILAATGTETTATTAQEFSTGAGNDYVQSAAGNDTLYLGDSGSNNFPGTSTAATQAQVATTRLMTLADGAGSLTDATTGQLTATADDTSASNTTAINTWADVANAGSGNDVVYGQNGTDFLYGGTGDDRLSGGAGIDGVRGGAGNDVLIGGQGNDVLRGDTGSDVFRWELADQGTTAAPASDIIMDFNTDSAAAGGDVLDLRDLLQGEATASGAPGNLGNFLHFTYSGADTIVQISTTGAFSAGFSSGLVDQSITLSGVNLTSGLSTDQAIIQDLLNKSKLLVDGG